VRKRTASVAIATILVLAISIFTATANDKTLNGYRNNVIFIDASKVKVINVSDYVKDGVYPKAIEICVGSLYFNESWGNPALAYIRDVTLKGVPEEGIYVKLWVSYDFDDTDWWASGDVNFEFRDDGGTSSKVIHDSIWGDQSQSGWLSPSVFKIYPGHTYDYHGKVWRGSESDESSGTLYVYS